MNGHCVLSDEELRINTSVHETVRRIYEGSKLFFFVSAIVVLWLVLSVIFDTFIFVRKIALVALGIGVFLGMGIGILWLFGVASGNLTRDTVIPLKTIKSVECSKEGIFPVILVNYQKNDSEVVRLLQFPYSWFSHTDAEFEKAKNLFKQKGIHTRQK